ncbi:MAG TPA: hypothetical protein VL916_00390 [Ilumatobacteraceae bacterium]|nr:hypothetical protein [Ilumatobacteraceae bacterium]
MLEVADRWSPYLQLKVVPRGRRTVTAVDGDRLRITVVQRVVMAAVREVYPPDERHVVAEVAAVADDEQLLMVASTSSHPFVDEHLPAGLVDVVGKLQVLLLAEARLVRV